MPADSPSVRVLAFDVFGTVVDWHGGVAAEVAAVAAAHGWPVDAQAFAAGWRAGYAPAMDEVRRRARPWTTLDELHRGLLDRLLGERGWHALDEAERRQLNRAWHRLPAWPDAPPGLARLKRRFTLTTLSNGNFSLLTDLARHAGLPWDCVISAELFGHYKPDPQVYLGCARLLDVAPADVMMVACHPSDLRAAAALGLRTAYVERALEHGPSTSPPVIEPGEFDVVARDFQDLADRLGVP